MYTRAQAQRKHIQKRALERLGIILSEDDIDGLIHQVQSGKAVFLQDYENSDRAWYAMEHEGEPAVWLYDGKTEQLVTVVTVGMFGNAATKKKQKRQAKAAKLAKREKRHFKARQRSMNATERASLRAKERREWREKRRET